jgi:hypothetical protein
MKRLALSLLLIAACTAGHAQTTATKLPAVDKSPLDICYYPNNYPVLKIQEKASEPLVARVLYSRPLKNGRTVFGDLVEYNKVWRLGANEATEVEFYRDVKVGGKKVPKGRYTLYALVGTDAWTMILNKDTDTWGAFKYDENKDVARVEVPVQKNAAPVEAFTIYFDKGANGPNLWIGWDELSVTLPISLK